MSRRSAGPRRYRSAVSRSRSLRTRPVSARLRSPSNALASVEAELLAERASALGRAGTRLDRALAAWARHEAGEAAEQVEREALLDAIREAAYALLVQRDCAGFRCDNLAWIRAHYDIPDAAFRRI